MSDRMADFSEGSIAATTSVLALAGIGETSLLEQLPKGALILIASALLSVVLFFVKRDAARYKMRFDRMEDMLKEQAKNSVTNDHLRHELAQVHTEIRTIDRRLTVSETHLSGLREALRK